MSIKDRTQLLRNGYAVDTDGSIETQREPHTSRWEHTRIAVIRLDAVESKGTKEFIAKVLAADCIEPGALVGVGRTGAVFLFKVAAVRDIARFLKEDFVIDGKAFTLSATVGMADAQLIDVGAFTWKDGRSPLTTHRDALPPLFWDITTTVYEAIKRLLPESGGRLGPLKTATELTLEKYRAERAARAAAGIVEEEKETPESADEKLVAANPTLGVWDGEYGMLVSLARTRIAARKEAEREEEERKEADEKTVAAFGNSEIRASDGIYGTQVEQARERIAARTGAEGSPAPSHGMS